jgi:hypothetical protein
MWTLAMGFVANFILKQPLNSDSLSIFRNMAVGNSQRINV